MQRNKNYTVSSDAWDLGHDSPVSLYLDALGMRRREGEEVLRQVKTLLEDMPTVHNMGMCMLQALGILWKRLNREIKLLQASKEDSKWGDKSARRLVLRKYRMTDYIYDNHPDRRDELIFYIQAHRLTIEELILELAKEFSINIPVKKPFEFFNVDSQSFEIRDGV